MDIKFLLFYSGNYNDHAGIMTCINDLKCMSIYVYPDLNPIQLTAKEVYIAFKLYSAIQSMSNQLSLTVFIGANCSQICSHLLLSPAHIFSAVSTIVFSVQSWKI